MGGTQNPDKDNRGSWNGGMGHTEPIAWGEGVRGHSVCTEENGGYGWRDWGYTQSRWWGRGGLGAHAEPLAGGSGRGM